LYSYNIRKAIAIQASRLVTEKLQMNRS